MAAFSGGSSRRSMASCVNRRRQREKIHEPRRTAGLGVTEAVREKESCMTKQREKFSNMRGARWKLFRGNTDLTATGVGATRQLCAHLCTRWGRNVGDWRWPPPRSEQILLAVSTVPKDNLYTPRNILHIFILAIFQCQLLLTSVLATVLSKTNLSINYTSVSVTVISKINFSVSYTSVCIPECQLLLYLK